MRTRNGSWAWVVTLWATGCAGQAAMEPAPATVVAAPPAAAPPMASPAFVGGGESRSSLDMSEAAPPPPPASVASESRGAAAPTPPVVERPGLGTEWGESRTSYVHDVDFQRADFTHPFAVATMHYNDRRGVEALAAYHGGHVPRFREQLSAGGAISVSVRDENDAPLEAIQLQDRTYIIGEQGERYSIVIANRSNHRVEAVTTVDGVDVMNGETGSVENRGYVLDPHETYVVDGFRRSQSQVAAFRFARVADSYAAQTGSARNVGVIGIAFFDERGDSYARWTPWTREELRLRDTANPFPEVNDRYAKPPPRSW
jgi:hypothetical protein